MARERKKKENEKVSKAVEKPQKEKKAQEKRTGNAKKETAEEVNGRKPAKEKGNQDKKSGKEAPKEKKDKKTSGEKKKTPEGIAEKPSTGEIAKEVTPEPGVPEAESAEDGTDELCLRTDVDRLFHLVEKKGKLDITKASRIFKVPESKIEEWGQILEEHGLIELHYPPIGKPLLKKRACNEETNAKKKSS